MAEKNQYRTVVGVVQFPPKDGEAADQKVRNITVQQAGFGPTAVRVSATIWPSHASTPLKVGDVVVLEGKYTPNKATKDDGEVVTYHNLSVSRLAVLGSVSEGSREDAPAATAEVDDEDIPF